MKFNHTWFFYTEIVVLSLVALYVLRKFIFFTDVAFTVVRFLRVMNIARVDQQHFVRLASRDDGEDALLLVCQSVSSEAALLCRRGEQLADGILESETNDFDARLMKKKLAFMKGRPDLFEKYLRLPYIVYDWKPDDPTLGEKARDFKRDWKDIEFSFSVMRSLI